MGEKRERERERERDYVRVGKKDGGPSWSTVQYSTLRCDAMRHVDEIR